MKLEKISECLKHNQIPFQEDLPEKLEIYLRLLQEWNSRMDPTAVEEETEMADRHFVDSLAVLRTNWLFPGAALIDVGTGAGFPGMVLAMARPDLQVTLMDAQRKRLAFLEALRDAADIRNTEIIHSRAEDAARNKRFREKYDIAAARALAPLNVLCEYLLPFVKNGGCALCWKGPALKQELDAGERAAGLLGGHLGIQFSYVVAGREWEHMILPVRKTEKTPFVYPRRAGIPKSKPLGELPQPRQTVKTNVQKETE